MSNTTLGAASSTTDQSRELYRDQNDTWVDRYSPDAAKPYLKLMRIDRPIGTWLVLLPGWWGLSLAAEPGCLPEASTMLLFALGAFAMRGAGCTVNDIWDRDFDRHVARTSQRPLAAQKLSVLSASTFLGIQLTAALAVVSQLNPATIAAGACCVPLVITYPLLKRVTHLPQVALGFAMNAGVVLGVLASTSFPAATPDSQASLAALAQLLVEQPGVLRDQLAMGLQYAAPFYAGAILWTVVYDTIYAHQDKLDDARLGLKSTALLFGDSTKGLLSSLAIAASGLFAFGGYAHDLHASFYLAPLAVGAHMLWQTQTADYQDRANLTQRFVSNAQIGWILLAGILAGRYFQKKREEDGGGAAAVQPVKSWGKWSLNSRH